MNQVKIIGGETLYSSKVIELETGKKHSKILRDIRNALKELRNPDLDSTIISSSFIFEFEKVGLNTKQVWMNRRAIELITTA